MDSPDARFAAAKGHAALRLRIMHRADCPPRAADLYLLAEPHIHNDVHCCPYAEHDHHVPGHDPAWCRSY